MKRILLLASIVCLGLYGCQAPESSAEPSIIPASFTLPPTPDMSTPSPEASLEPLDPLPSALVNVNFTAATPSPSPEAEESASPEREEPRATRRPSSNTSSSGNNSSSNNNSSNNNSSNNNSNLDIDDVPSEDEGETEIDIPIDDGDSSGSDDIPTEGDDSEIPVVDE